MKLLPSKLGYSENAPASGFTTYQPAACAIIPRIHVPRIPIRMSPFTLKWCNTAIIRSPTSASINGGLFTGPRSTSVELLATVIPAPFRPIMVINSPIPAVIPYLRLSGISLTSFSLKFVRDRRMNAIPSTNTAARAIVHGFLIPASAIGIQTE